MSADVRVDGPNGRIIHYVLKYNHDQKKRAEMLGKVINSSGGNEEVNSLDGKYKATPLHWARSKDDITQLVNFGAELEQKSFTDDRKHGIFIKNKCYFKLS